MESERTSDSEKKKEGNNHREGGQERKDRLTASER